MRHGAVEKLTRIQSCETCAESLSFLEAFCLSRSQHLGLAAPNFGNERFDQRSPRCARLCVFLFGRFCDTDGVGDDLRPRLLPCGLTPSGV